jgi:hypothetical protein
MFGNRDDIRRVYVDVWRKLKLGQPLEPMEGLIGEVIKLHPEYHAMLESGEDVFGSEFPVEGGQSNPFLHMGMHIALREQTSVDRPSGIKALHRSLCQRLGQHDAEHAMLECLGQSLWLAQRNNSAPDEQAYLECIKRIAQTKGPRS